MALWLWVAAALAAEVPSYRYVTPAEVEGAVQCDVTGPADGAVAGLSIAWTCGAVIGFRLQNDLPSTVRVLWDRSAYVDSAGLASNVVPGVTRVKDAGLAVPASVVPSGAALEEVLVPRSEMTTGSAIQLVHARDVGKQVQVNLVVERDGPTVNLVQRFDVRLDQATLDGLEDKRRRDAEDAEAKRLKDAAALAARQAAEEREDDLRWEVNTHQTNLAVYGLGTAGVVGLFGVLLPWSLATDDDPDNGPTQSDWAVFGTISGAALAVGVPLTVREWRKLKSAEDDLARLRGTRSRADD